jgi:hypothetical protein
MLLEQEIAKLRTGVAVLPFLDPMNQIATKQEVLKLARGIFDEKAKAFIIERESKIRRENPIIAKSYIDKTINIREQKKQSKEHPQTFEQAFAELKSDFPNLIYRLLKGKVSQIEARELNMRLVSFPAIRTAAMANAYLTSILIIHGVAPGKDKIDDYRHLIEASYCDVFISDDNQLIKNIPQINPNIEVVEWKNFIKNK